MFALDELQRKVNGTIHQKKEKDLLNMAAVLYAVALDAAEKGYSLEELAALWLEKNGK